MTEAPASGRVVAAFDFDGTLSRRDSLVPFLLRVAGPVKLTGTLTRLLPRLARSRLDDGARDDAKGRLLRRLLAGRRVTDVEATASAYARDLARTGLRRDVVERLDWHHAQGHEVVIVSASLGLYLRPVAAQLGIDAVLATELAAADGVLTGEIAGTNIRRAEKVRRLEAWLGPEPAFVWAYGDSTGDRELLARADRPIMVSGRAGGAARLSS